MPTASIPADQTVTTEPGAVPDDAAFDELMAGLPEEMKHIRLDRIAGDDPAIPVRQGLDPIPPGKVMLLNLRFQDQVFFVPEGTTVTLPNGETRKQLQFVGQTRIEFVNGKLLCTAEQAEYIQSRAPWVHVEPPADSGLELHTHPVTKFQTRNASAMVEHTLRHAENG